MGGRRRVLEAVSCAGVASLTLTTGCLNWLQDAAPDGLTPPQAAFDIQYTLNTGTLTVLLVQGSEIPPDQVYIRGAELAETGSWTTLDGETSGPENTIVEGDSLDVRAAKDYTVRVVWERFGVSQMYTKQTGPDA